MLSDYPEDAFRRVGEFLNDEDRLALLAEEFRAPGVVDAWWIGFTEANAKLFLEAVHRALPRFLAQPSLIGKIMSSRELDHHMKMIEQTAAQARSLTSAPEEVACTPVHTAMCLDPSWYWAAEMVLREHEPDLLTSKYVDLLATDAWRVHNL